SVWLPLRQRLFARSERCYGVMVSRDRLPPILPLPLHLAFGSIPRCAWGSLAGVVLDRSLVRPCRRGSFRQSLTLAQCSGSRPDFAPAPVPETTSPHTGCFGLGSNWQVRQALCVFHRLPIRSRILTSRASAMILSVRSVMLWRPVSTRYRCTR